MQLDVERLVFLRTAGKKYVDMLLAGNLPLGINEVYEYEVTMQVLKELIAV